MQKVIVIAMFCLVCKTSNAQKLYKTMATEICDCITKKDFTGLDSLTTANEVSKCAATILYHSGEIKRKLNLDVLNEDDLEKISIEVMSISMRDCPAFVKIIANSVPLPATTESTIINTMQCDNAIEGTFVDQIDTNQILVRSRTEQLIKFVDSGTTSRSEIKWITPCKYKLIFKESNNPLVNSFLTKNEVIEVELTTISGDTVSYNSSWRGIAYSGKMVKIRQ
ncbi:MAG: hypothetical protein POELPBGB_00899 [Bacteroidia bacterium]|nr:hypothetical protein [Bacteroidia bacterium]